MPAASVFAEKRSIARDGKNFAKEGGVSERRSGNASPTFHSVWRPFLSAFCSPCRSSLARSQVTLLLTFIVAVVGVLVIFLVTPTPTTTEYLRFCHMPTAEELADAPVTEPEEAGYTCTDESNYGTNGLLIDSGGQFDRLEVDGIVMVSCTDAENSPHSKRSAPLCSWSLELSFGWSCPTPLQRLP